MKQKISVIIPIHNTAEYVGDCLKSVLQQSYKEIEVLCIDSSTDKRTTAIVNKIAITDKRVKHIYDSNSSYGYKINQGIRNAIGDYISIIDSDDMVEDNIYEELSKYISNVDFVKCDYSEFYIDRGKKCISRYQKSTYDYLYHKVVNIYEYPELLYRNTVAVWSCLYKAEFIRKNNILMHESQGASFQDFGFAVLTHFASRKCYYINKSLYDYRIDNANSSVKSNSKVSEIVKESEWIEKKIAQTIHENPVMKEAWLKRKFISYMWNYNRLNDVGKIKFAYILKNYISEVAPKINEWDVQIEALTIFKEIKGISEEIKEMEKRIKDHDVIENSQIKISVIVPVYNTSKYIADCISSISNQDFKNIEIICVNDASTDESLQIINEMKCIDRRINIITNSENRGLAYTRNVGINAASGKYVLFIDSDDWYKQGTLNEVYEIAERNNTDIVYFDANCVFEEGVEYNEEKVNYYTHSKAYGKKSGRKILNEMTADNKFTDSACLMLINRQWLSQEKLKFYDGIIYEDCLFTVQCMMKAQTVVHVNEKYYQYRVRGNSILTSNQDRAINMYSRAIIYKEFLKMYEEEHFDKTEFLGLLRMIVFVRENIRNMSYRISDEELGKLAQFDLDKGISLALEMSDVSINKINDIELMTNVVEKMKKAEIIELYGAGIRCKRVIEFLNLTGQGKNVTNIIVSRKDNNADEFCGMKVEVMNQGYKPKKNALIVITMAGIVALQVAHALRDKGYENVVVIDKTTNDLMVQEIRTQLKI